MSGLFGGGDASGGIPQSGIVGTPDITPTSTSTPMMSTSTPSTGDSATPSNTSFNWGNAGKATSEILKVIAQMSAQAKGPAGMPTPTTGPQLLRGSPYAQLSAGRSQPVTRRGAGGADSGTLQLLLKLLGGGVR